jgi:alpha-L-fucosidase
MVWDIERGAATDIMPLPWQTDTCIGEWHYSRPVLARHGYKSAQMVAQMLVDIVSKNGNLMLNIPLPGSGAPDDDELMFVADFGRMDERQLARDLREPTVGRVRRRPFGEGAGAAPRPGVQRGTQQAVHERGSAIRAEGGESSTRSRSRGRRTA